MPETSTPIRVLRVDASARREGSASRRLGDRMVERLQDELGPVEVTRRDVASGLPFVDHEWVSANFTDRDERTPAQHEALALSDRLIAELKATDILVICTPIYNFGIPASLKAWIDLVARARETFRYSKEGPVGLLRAKQAYVLVASGGTRVGSRLDFAIPYLQHLLGFVGIQNVEIIAADRRNVRGREAVAEAEQAIRALQLTHQELP